MAEYDFSSYYNRMSTRASKWVHMIARKPDVASGVVPMSVADMDFATAPEIVSSLQNYTGSELLGYSRPTDAYLQTVIQYYQRVHDYQAKKEWVFTVPGVVPALAAAVRVCTRAEESVVILSPIYGPFADVVAGQGRKIAYCPLIEKNRRYEIDFDSFTRICNKPEVKLFLLCSPHNPSGRVWSREELARLADICQQHGVSIASDEIHSDIMLGDRKHWVFHTVSESARQAILCTSAGKTYNIEALQCANVFIQDPELYRKYEENNNAAGIERANVLGMVATAAAYRDADCWKQEMLAVIRRNMQILLDFLSAYEPALCAMVPDAGFLCWVDYSGMGVSREDFLRFLVDWDIYVSDGPFEGPGSENHIRINVGLPTRALRDNLTRLEKGLREQYRLMPKRA